MNKNTNPYKLFRRIIDRSRAKDWHNAKLEWDLIDIYIDEDETCLCGHHPIKEICVMKNRVNHKQVIVGNCCVNRFIGIPSNKMFRGIERVVDDQAKSFPRMLIQHSHNKGWINTWERDFYLDVIKKRKLSKKQLNKKMEINKNILYNIDIEKTGL